MSTLTSTQLQQQYIAYFGRPGDPAGLKYWLSSTSGISTARDFADLIYAQDEYKTSTVGSKSTEEQVNNLYQNLFNRDADSDGLLYWTAEIEKGNLKLSNVAYDLIWAASNPTSGNTAQAATDALTLTNKVTAAEAFTADVEASTPAILAYQPAATSPWKSGEAFASAVAFIQTATATNSPTAADVDSAVASVVTANQSTGSTADSKNLKFTTTTDALIGDTGADSFTGVLQDGGATGTTIAPGDSVEGKGGTDTLTISVAGDHNKAAAGYTLSAVQTTDVEKVFASNFETESDELTTVATDLMSGVTTLGLSASSATGDTTFSGIKNLVDAEMRNGAADLTLSYTSSVLSGSDDTQKLTVSGATAGTFTVNNAETFAITSELTKSTLTDIAGDSDTKITIDGAANLVVTNALATKTIDASATTGGVSLKLGTATHTVTGGSGDDVINAVATLSNLDTITGGAGSDTFSFETAAKVTADAKTDAAAAGALVGVTGFETIEVISTNASAELELASLSGVTDLTASQKSRTVTLTSSANNGTNATYTFTLNGTSLTTATVDLATGDATADMTAVASAIATKITAQDGFTASSAANVVTVNRPNIGEVIQFTGAAQSNNNATLDAATAITFSKASGTEKVSVVGDSGNVTYSLADASGTADSATFNLKNDSDDKAIAQTVADLTVSNTETVNIDVTGMKAGTAKTLSALSGDAALTTLNITGDSDFVLTDHGSDNSKLATITSTSTGDITISDSVAGTSKLAQTITTGSGNDSMTFDSGELTEADVINLGGNTVVTSTGLMGKDTLNHTGDLGSSVDYEALQVSNVETINLTGGTGAGTAVAMYVDAANMTDNGTIALAGASGNVKIKNLDTTTKVGLGIGANDLSATLEVTLADETGTSDSIDFVESSTLNASSAITLKSTGIETLNIQATGDSTSAKTTTFTFGDNAPSTINITKGQASDTVALGTLNKTTTVVDASTYLGALSLTGATGIAMTVDAKLGGASTINTGSGADTINLGNFGTAAHTVATGDGTDVINVTLDSAASDMRNVSGAETLNLTIKDSTSAGLNDAAEDGGIQAAKTINVLGGNSLSKFVVTTANFSTTTTTLIDASTFNGDLDILIAPDNADSTLSIKGGTSANDEVNVQITAASEKFGLMTGIEKLVVNSDADGGDVDGALDLVNASGLSEITVSYGNASNADALEFKNVDTGVKFKVTSTVTADKLTVGMEEASSADTALNVEITDVANTATNVFDLDAAGIESLTLTSKEPAGDDGVDLAGVTADTDLTTALTLEGTSFVLKNLSTSFASVDGQQLTGALTLANGDRPSTAMTITGGLGDDTIGMENASDVIDGGLGTDTLNIKGSAVLGGFNVDLTSTTDQVTQFAGVTNATIQKGFEHVSLSESTGTGGASITGTDAANTLTGTGNADVIDGGKGADQIDGGGGADFMTGGKGADDFVISNTVTIGGSLNNGTISGYDTITDFTMNTTVSGSSEELELTGTAALNAVTSSNSTTDSTLTVGGQVSAGLAIATDGEATTSKTTVAIAVIAADGADSLAIVAAMVQTLSLNDIGDAGDTAWFTGQIDGVDNSWVYTQTTAATGASGGYDLVNLQGIKITALMTTNTSTTAGEVYMS
jgi:hypothetical protein